MKLTFPVTDMKDLKKSKLEVALDKCNHTMELVRTIIPILILIIQIIILFKIL
jgi:heme/copper-type cytochrome/quinol oxidase subunit 2